MKLFSGKSVLRVVSMALVVVMALSLTACNKDPEEQPSSGSIIENSSELPSASSSSSESSTSSESATSGSSESSTGSSSSAASGAPKETRTPAEIQKDLLNKMVAAHKKTEDVVGWLYVPNTYINEPIVHTVDNDYFLRRSWDSKSYFYGCYYGDFRGTFGNRQTLSKNTVIYGHSMSDNPTYMGDGTTDSIKFGGLNHYLDPAFAAENQFIYFSTPESDMIWQVFAVVDTTTSVNYNSPNLSDADRLAIINKARSNSKMNFSGVTVGANDKILTLSTCTYRHDKNYPNNYRFVVMAKLLDKNATLTPAKVEVNPSAGIM